MKRHKILVVDDDRQLQGLIKISLERDGYAVASALKAADVAPVLEAEKVDIILLDLMLPDSDGLTLLKMIHGYTNAPIIIISAKDTMTDKVVGLEMGADDYVSKPFEMRELSARIKANLRRYEGKAPDGAKMASSFERARRIKFGDFILDREAFLMIDGKGIPVDLSIKEFRLLEVLVMVPNRVLSRDHILDKARDGSFDVFDRAIDVQIARIRKKIGDGAQEPNIIKTVRGVGYMLSCPVEILE